MGVCYYVEGIRPPDERWKKYKAAYDAWRELPDSGELPEQLLAFFDHRDPDKEGVIVDLDECEEAVTEWEEEGRSGYQVDLSKIPKDLKILRFVISY